MYSVNVNAYININKTWNNKIIKTELNKYIQYVSKDLNLQFATKNFIFQHAQHLFLSFLCVFQLLVGR